MKKLKSLNIALRNFNKNDNQRMVELANNKRVSENLRDAFPHPYTLEDANKFIERCMAQDPVMTFAIIKNDLYIGNISLTPGNDVYRRTVELGYFIGEPYWNKNIATKAVDLITNYAFNELKFARIHAGVFEFNTASQRVLEKCGFKKEGVFEKNIFKNNQLWDEYRYAKITAID